MRAAGLATVLPLALQAAGHHLLHASAVESEGGVVVFCGRSGAGKSTIAYTLARHGRHGWRQWADDAVAFEIEGDQATSRRLPFVPRLRPDASMRFGKPGLTSATPKAERRRIVAIHLLERGAADAEPTVEPLRLGDAFPALLDNAYRFPGGDRPIGALGATYLDLATRVPTTRLTVPDDLDRLDETLDRLAL